MPDSKITALTALTAADPAVDMFPVVDVSDTTMAASGTTKRISINNILACSPVATLASLNVTGSSIPANGLYLPTTNTLEFAANSLAQYRIAPLGVFSWYDGAGGTRMTLNSTGLGIGTTVLGGNKLAIGSTSDTSATTNAINIVTNRATITTTCNGAVDAAGTTINYSWANGGQGPLIFRNAAISNVMTLDASGNCGIGVTPSATSSTYFQALEIARVGQGLTAAKNALTGSPSSWLSNNSYATYSSGVVWNYAISQPAAQYRLFEGQHQWFNAPSGTAGNAITWTQAMTLDASGRLILLASTTTPATLATNGQLTFTATSNTNLRFSYRGSDGVTRTADLTLA